MAPARICRWQRHGAGACGPGIPDLPTARSSPGNGNGYGKGSGASAGSGSTAALPVRAMNRAQPACLLGRRRSFATLPLFAVFRQRQRRGVPPPLLHAARGRRAEATPLLKCGKGAASGSCRGVRAIGALPAAGGRGCGRAAGGLRPRAPVAQPRPDSVSGRLPPAALHQSAAARLTAGACGDPSIRRCGARAPGAGPGRLRPAAAPSPCGTGGPGIRWLFRRS